MRTRSFLAGSAAALIALGPAVRAQAPVAPAAVTDIAVIRKLLQSDIASEQAWGAWFAGQTQRTELVPDLVKLGSDSRLETDRPRQALVDVLLDALVQLKAAPEPSWTISFFERRPTQSLILLANSGDKGTPVLLDLTRTQKGIRWLAAANVLLARRPAGFAAVLLDGLTVRGDLYITNSPNKGFGTGASSDGSVADGMGAPPTGFPPSTNYYLTLGDYPGAVVLAAGTRAIRTVYYMRGVYPPGQQYPASWSDRTAPTSQDRLDYIAALRTTSLGSYALRANETKTVVWKSGMSFDREVAAYRAELTQRYDSLVRTLVQEKLLTDEEAKALPAPTISVIVQDTR
jgi:hypothetical protein